MENHSKLRLDKWLWHARFFKSRSLAASQIAGGSIRLNGQRIDKRATMVGPGDVLTFTQGRALRVVEVLDIGIRRGPASEAQALYTDLSPTPSTATAPPQNPRFEGKGRPTKKDRRGMDLSKESYLE